MLPLIVPPDGAGTSAVLNNGPEVHHPAEGIEPSTATNKKELNWKCTVSATAKLLLRTARESSDAFPPLKSVTGGLCAILENFEVWSTPRFLDPRCLQLSQQTMANKEAIESLAPRVNALAKSLCVPVSESDIGEKSRRETLEG